MKRFLNLLSVAVLLLGLSGVANAYTYTIDYSNIPVGNEFTSPYSTTVENFEGPLAWTWLGSYEIVSGDSSGKYSAPAGVGGVKDASKYVTVPKSNSGGSGSVTVTLGGTYTYFGLWWGSMDDYNTLTFLYNGVSTGEFVTGSDLTNPANGDQTSPSTNQYVNFHNLKAYNGFEMSSRQFAFEADNIAVGSPVPIPAAVWLFGTGLLGLVGVRRKIRK